MPFVMRQNHLSVADLPGTGQRRLWRVTPFATRDRVLPDR